MSRIGRSIRNFVREWAPVIVAVLLIRSFLVEAFMVPTGSMLDTIQIGDFMLVNKFVYGPKIPFTDQTLLPVSQPRRGDIIVFRFPVDPDVPEPASRFVRLFPARLQLLPLFWDRQAHFFRWYVPRNFVKRCIAVAGDTVLYREKRLYVNGRLQEEPYVVHRDLRMLPELEGPPLDFTASWRNRAFYRTELSPYIRDHFGPVVVPPGCVFAMGDNRDDSEDSRFWGPLELRHLRGKPLVLYFSSAAAPNIARIILSPWSIRFERIGRLVR